MDNCVEIYGLFFCCRDPQSREIYYAGNGTLLAHSVMVMLMEFDCQVKLLPLCTTGSRKLRPVFSLDNFLKVQ